MFIYIYVLFSSRHFCELPSWNCSIIRILRSHWLLCATVCLHSVYARVCLRLHVCSLFRVVDIILYLNKSKIAYCEMRSNKMVKWNAKFSCVFEYTFISII